MYNYTSTFASYGFGPWDNPLDVVSYSDYQMMLFIINTVTKPVIVVVGVPSNIISCVVFWRQGLGDRMNVCLFALSLVDLSLLLVSVVYGVGHFLAEVDPVRYGGAFEFLLAAACGVNQGFRSAAGCITMVIAVERCLCVVFPLKAASLISTRNMAVTIVGIVCLTQVAFLTTPATFTVIKVSNSSAKFVIALSDFYTNNAMLVDVLQSIIMTSVLPLTTFVVTGLSTGLTVVRLKTAMRWRGQASRSSVRGQVQQTALTKMLVVVSCVYILTTIPWVVFYLATFLVENASVERPYYTYYNFFWLSTLTANQFSCLNSLMSFFVYFLRSTRFRKDVLMLFGCYNTFINKR